MVFPTDVALDLICQGRLKWLLALRVMKAVYAVLHTDFIAFEVLVPRGSHICKVRLFQRHHCCDVVLDGFLTYMNTDHTWCHLIQGFVRVCLCV